MFRSRWPLYNNIKYLFSLLTPHLLHPLIPISMTASIFLVIFYGFLFGFVTSNLSRNRSELCATKILENLFVCFKIWFFKTVLNLGTNNRSFLSGDCPCIWTIHGSNSSLCKVKLCIWRRWVLATIDVKPNECVDMIFVKSFTPAYFP